MAKTIVGMYDSAEKARDVVNALVAAGCSRDDISLLARGQADQEWVSRDKNLGDKETLGAEGTATGAGIGAALGGLGGVLVGLGILAIPGIGPIVAAGPIAAGLVGAAGGAVAGGLIGGLIGLGIPEEEAHVYAEGVRRGSTLVTVKSPDDRAGEVSAVMNRFDPIDVNTRSAEWRSEGWSGRYDADKTSDTIIPVAEEELAVGKRTVDSGGVRVHSRVIEEPVREDVTLRDEKVRVERRPTDRVIGQGEGAFDERSMEMRETSEEAVVGKRTRVKEEVRLSKEEGEHEEHIDETVRKTDVDIENLSGKPTPGERPHR